MGCALHHWHCCCHQGPRRRSQAGQAHRFTTWQGAGAPATGPARHRPTRRLGRAPHHRREAWRVICFARQSCHRAVRRCQLSWWVRRTGTGTGTARRTSRTIANAYMRATTAAPRATQASPRIPPHRYRARNAAATPNPPTGSLPRMAEQKSPKATWDLRAKLENAGGHYR